MLQSKCISQDLLGELSTRSNTVSEWKTTIDRIQHSYESSKLNGKVSFKVGMIDLKEEESTEEKVVKFHTSNKRLRSESEEEEHTPPSPHKCQFSTGVDPTQWIDKDQAITVIVKMLIILDIEVDEMGAMFQRVH